MYVFSPCRGAFGILASRNDSYYIEPMEGKVMWCASIHVYVCLEYVCVYILKLCICVTV